MTPTDQNLDDTHLQEEPTHLLLQAVLEFRDEGWLDRVNIKDLARKLDVRALDDQIYFYRELLDIARAVPQKVYGEAQNRVRFIQSIQTILDEAVAREEG